MGTPSTILSPLLNNVHSQLEAQQLGMDSSGIGAVQGYTSTPESFPLPSPPPQPGLEPGGLPIPLLQLSQWRLQKELSQGEYLAAQQHATVRTNGRLFFSAREVANKELAVLGPVLVPSSMNEGWREAPRVDAPEPGSVEFEEIVVEPPSPDTNRTYPVMAHAAPRCTTRRTLSPPAPTSAPPPITVPEPALAPSSRRDHVSAPSDSPVTVTDGNGDNTAFHVSPSLPITPPYLRPLARPGTLVIWFDCSVHPEFSSDNRRDVRDHVSKHNCSREILKRATYTYPCCPNCGHECFKDCKDDITQHVETCTSINDEPSPLDVLLTDESRRLASLPHPKARRKSRKTSGPKSRLIFSDESHGEGGSEVPHRPSRPSSQKQPLPASELSTSGEKAVRPSSPELLILSAETLAFEASGASTSYPQSPLGAPGKGKKAHNKKAKEVAKPSSRATSSDTSDTKVSLSVEGRREEVKYSNSGRPQRGAGLKAQKIMAATIGRSLEWDDEEFQPDEPRKRKDRTSLDGTTQQESEFVSSDSRKKSRLSVAPSSELPAPTERRRASPIPLKPILKGLQPDPNVKKRTLSKAFTKVEKNEMIPIYDGDTVPIHDIRFVQDRTCQRMSPPPWQGLCCHCRKRKSGDTCRFMNIRELCMKGDKYVGQRFISAQSEEPLEFGSFFGEDKFLGKHGSTSTIKMTIAKALVPLLERELQHLQSPKLIRRPREVLVRATCDICMTSIFAGCWMGTCCARELCSDCYDELRKYDDEVPTDGDIHILGRGVSPGERKIRYCAFRRAHYSNAFIPVSRFDKSHLKSTLDSMKLLSLQPSKVMSAPNKCEELSEFFTRVLATFPNSDDHSIIRRIPDPCGALSHPLLVFPPGFITDERFPDLWGYGEPFVVGGCLEKSQLQWTPEYFQREYGEQPCLVMECQTQTEVESTVATFFQRFGVYEERAGCYKLRDWPPTQDFQQTFPELYEDFSAMLPAPAYTRRDGVMNISSHFPTNAITPDLGPKMYNAFEASESEGAKGSTRLHMDMADAVNIMMYAAKREDGSDGYAVWNIYRAMDSKLIREFLDEHFPSASEGLDPIHSQVHFLDVALRKQLFEEKGVGSYRIMQKPGEAVFIPAGCAHQVSNVGDCIKVAVDFVSPANVDRCEKLTHEFREQNRSTAWKEDVLQLRTMMWYAWESCRRLEERDGDKPDAQDTRENVEISADSDMDMDLDNT